MKKRTGLRRSLVLLIILLIPVLWKGTVDFVCRNNYKDPFDVAEFDREYHTSFAAKEPFCSRNIEYAFPFFFREYRYLQFRDLAEYPFTSLRVYEQEMTIPKDERPHWRVAETEIDVEGLNVHVGLYRAGIGDSGPDGNEYNPAFKYWFSRDGYFYVGFIDYNEAMRRIPHELSAEDLAYVRKNIELLFFS